MAFLLPNIFEKLNSRGEIPKFIRIWPKNWRKIQKTNGKTENSRKKLKTQGKNSSFGRIFPRLRDQVVLKKKPEVDVHGKLGYSKAILLFQLYSWYTQYKYPKNACWRVWYTPFNSPNNPYEKGISCSKFLRYKKLFTRKIFTPYDLQKSSEMIMQFNCPPIPSK